MSDTKILWTPHIIGPSSTLINVSGIIYDADTITWAAQVVTNGGAAPSATSKGYVDALIRAIKADANLGPNLNSVLDRMYLFANYDTTGNSETTDAQALTSIVNPASTEAAPFGSWNSGTLGWQGDGSTGYVKCNYYPTGANGNYSLNSASMGTYGLTSGTTDNNVSMGFFDGANMGDCVPYNAGSFAGMNTTTLFAGPLNNQNGFTITTRTAASGANATVIYNFNSGGPYTTNSAAASTGIPAGTATAGPFIFCRNDSNVPTAFISSKLAVSFIGGGLSSTAAASLAFYVNAYLTSLGINVYPN